ncbi:hypothetical protein SAMN05421776_103298 [Nocardia farcinica]|uniref:Uncharacterized protein n=1 Tax=Nocardia farcinica TaxID=37329 RepID=A0A0H5NZI4_NOCFR|nr:Uncharacterised protein [Nocardia farcinica]SIT10563.1 hypothetical protein SAMN05421776_103298 [Nocardia farcinica]
MGREATTSRTHKGESGPTLNQFGSPERRPSPSSAWVLCGSWALRFRRCGDRANRPTRRQARTGPSAADTNPTTREARPAAPSTALSRRESGRQLHRGRRSSAASATPAGLIAQEHRESTWSCCRAVASGGEIMVSAESRRSSAQPTAWWFRRRSIHAIHGFRYPTRSHWPELCDTGLTAPTNPSPARHAIAIPPVERRRCDPRCLDEPGRSPVWWLSRIIGSDSARGSGRAGPIEVKDAHRIAPVGCLADLVAVLTEGPPAVHCPPPVMGPYRRQSRDGTRATQPEPFGRGDSRLRAQPLGGSGRQ